MSDEQMDEEEIDELDDEMGGQYFLCSITSSRFINLWFDGLRC